MSGLPQDLDRQLIFTDDEDLTESIMDDESLNNDEVNKDLIRNFSAIDENNPNINQSTQNGDMSHSMRFSVQPDMKGANHMSTGGNDMLFAKKMTMPAPSMLFYPTMNQNSGTEFLRASR
jgi:hypothetical protein